MNLKESNVQSKTCKIEPKIPFYLIVAGILNLVLMAVRIIFQVSSNINLKENGDGWSMIIIIYTFASLFHPMHFFQRCCKKCADNNSDNAACATCGFLANLACINFYDMIALTLIIIWLGMYTNVYSSRLYNLTRIYI